jgi:ATP-dependent Clp protease protease subunit
MPGTVTQLEIGVAARPDLETRACSLCWQQSRPQQIRLAEHTASRDGVRTGGISGGQAHRKESDTMVTGMAAGATATLDDQLSTRLLHERIIVLGADVEDQIANRICAELLVLSAEDQRRDIALFINSRGGSVLSGLAIYDTMRLIPNDVITLAMGLAGSMGQFLLCAGTPGKRFALPNAQILMHQGSAGLGGTAADVQIYASQLERLSKLMSSLTAQHTGQSTETIHDDGQRDRWFSAEEALAYGMVDHIVERMDDVRPGVGQQRLGM